MYFEKKDIVIVCLFILLSFTVWKILNIKEIEASTNFEKKIENDILVLSDKNDSISYLLKQQKDIITSYENKIDSLNGIKKQIQTTYEKKQKQIDTYSANSTIKEFSDIFAKDSIK